MAKNVTFNPQAFDHLRKGVDTICNATKATLGPKGRNVLIKRLHGYPISTKDGVTVANEISLPHPIEDLGAQIVKQAASKTSERAGDGTTTSMVLAQAIIQESRLSELSPIEIKRSLDKEVPYIIDFLKSQSSPVTTPQEVEDIATISSNNDPTLGKLIAEAFHYVGPTGIITMEDSKTTDTYIKVVEGTRMDRGFLSHYFINQAEKQQVILENPYILFYDGKLKAPNEIVPLLKRVHEANRPLVVVADEVDGQALSLMIVNKMQGNLQCAAVKAPAYGDRRVEILKDLSTLTGAALISPTTGTPLASITTEHLGECEKIIIDAEETIIISPKGEREAILRRIEEVKAQLSLATDKYILDKTSERLANLQAKTAAIYVGAPTEADLEEKKHRVDDAIQATRAAIKSGYLPGGGTALLRAAAVTNSDILKRALTYPYDTILSNAGLDTPFPLSLPFNHGVDANTGKVVDMIESKIIDPTLVVTEALQNAVSAASTLLLTEVTIYEENQPQELPDYDS